jgi:hypothetical protein
MIIPVSRADIPTESDTISIAIGHNNLPGHLPYAAIRDSRLLKDLESYARIRKLNFHQTFSTDNLLFLSINHKSPTGRCPPGSGRDKASGDGVG